MLQPTKKRITNYQDLEKIFVIAFSDKEKKMLTDFLKKKTIYITGKKIVYPTPESIKLVLKNLLQEISKIDKSMDFWKSTKNKITRDKKLFPITLYFKKNFWRHKIKEITNKEYRQDVIDTGLNQKILLDPEHQNLFETFLINPDYRKKLKETVNTSIVYKYNSIGMYSKKKKEFKIKTSEMKIKQLIKLKQKFVYKKEIYELLAEIVKKHS